MKNNLIDEKRLEEILKQFENSGYRYPVQDVLETLSLALKVVRAAQKVQSELKGVIHRDDLADALAPFSQPRSDAGTQGEKEK